METPTGIRSFGGEDIVSFGVEDQKPLQLKINGELYEAVPDIPAGTMADLAATYAELNSAANEKKLEMMLDFFEVIFLEESYTRFRDRLNSREKPIGLRTLVDVIQYLMGEAYGLRPTQPSESSTGGPGETGPSSTGGAPAEESTPDTSPGTAT